MRSIIRHPVVPFDADRWLVSLSDQTFLYDPATESIEAFGDGQVDIEVSKKLLKELFPDPVEISDEKLKKIFDKLEELV